MKKLYTLTLFLLVAMTANSQITDVVIGLGNPSRIIIVDNTMYIADNTTGKVLKTDYTESNPVVATLFENLDFPYGLYLDGSDIYVTTSSDIFKFDYNAPSPSLEVVIEGLAGPESLVKDGDILYVSEYFGNQISKIDLAATTPTAEVIAAAGRPDQMVLVGDFLYYIEYSNNKISKIDVTEINPTPIDVVTGLQGPTGMLLIGNDLYIAEFQGGAISKIDITETIPTVLNVQSGLAGPTDIVKVNDEFFVAEYSSGKIVKFTDPTLSLNPVNAAQTSISIYPNPTTSVLKVSGLMDTQSYALYNVTGSMITKGSVSNNEAINVSNLSNGLYFLKLEGGSNFKFIKN